MRRNPTNCPFGRPITLGRRIGCLKADRVSVCGVALALFILFAGSAGAHSSTVAGNW